MDEPDDTFFSTEALRLLEAHRVPPDAQAPEVISSWDTLVIDRDCGSRSTAAAASDGRKRAPDSPHRAESGYSVFSAASDQGPRHKRGKFEDPKRRAEVAQVRKEGACLRCRWSKSPCSSTRPCTSCISSWISLNGRPSKFQWMDCVPFSWKDVNIYALDDLSQDYNIILQDCSVLMEEHTELDFNEAVHWDINALSTDFAAWMAVDNVHPAATSRVGILSSVECQGLLHRYLDEELCIQLRLLIKASSLLYNRKNCLHPHYDRERLALIRSTVGSQFLTNLETALKSTALAKASKEKLMGLFLVLLGAIIAITYTTGTGSEEARCELLRILAHHTILIAERISLIDDDLTKQRLTTSCQNLWNKTGNFVWSYKMVSAVESMEFGASPKPSPIDFELPSASTAITAWPRDRFRELAKGQIEIIASCNINTLTTTSFSPPSAGSVTGDTETMPIYGSAESRQPDTLARNGLQQAESNIESSPMAQYPSRLPEPTSRDVPPNGIHESNILDFEALGAVTASTEDVSIYRNTEPWQPDSLATNSLHGPDSSNENIKVKRNRLPSMKPSKKNVPPDDHDTADQTDPRPQEQKTKRKLIIGKSKKIAQKPKAMVQNSPAQNKKTPPRSEESVPEIPSGGNDFRHIDPARTCSHPQCSSCRTDESLRRGLETWTCCHCKSVNLRSLTERCPGPSLV